MLGLGSVWMRYRDEGDSGELSTGGCSSPGGYSSDGSMGMEGG